MTTSDLVACQRRDFGRVERAIVDADVVELAVPGLRATGIGRQWFGVADLDMYRAARDGLLLRHRGGRREEHVIIERAIDVGVERLLRRVVHADDVIPEAV